MSIEAIVELISCFSNIYWFVFFTFCCIDNTFICWFSSFDCTCSFWYLVGNSSRKVRTCVNHCFLFTLSLSCAIFFWYISTFDKVGRKNFCTSISYNRWFFKNNPKLWKFLSDSRVWGMNYFGNSLNLVSIQGIRYTQVIQVNTQGIPPDFSLCFFSKRVLLSILDISVAIFNKFDLLHKKVYGYICMFLNFLIRM